MPRETAAKISGEAVLRVTEVSTPEKPVFEMDAERNRYACVLTVNGHSMSRIGSSAYWTVTHRIPRFSLLRALRVFLYGHEVKVQTCFAKVEDGEGGECG